MRKTERGPPEGSGDMVGRDAVSAGGVGGGMIRGRSEAEVARTQA